MLPEEISLLQGRLGKSLLQRRLFRQASKVAGLTHQGEGIFKLERILPFDQLVETVLQWTGLRQRAFREYLDVRVVTQTWSLPNLPAAFDGFRLLQLTDLHLDLAPDLSLVLQALLPTVPHDAAVITGDFRNLTQEDYAPCLDATTPLLPLLSPHRWGILGNHDFIEMALPLERAGLPILLNEVAQIEREGQQLWLAGTDDPHFYRTHDLQKLRRLIPQNACSILLTHSPELYQEADALGFHLLLCGHTHGGQLCLPGGHHLVAPCQVPRRFIRGRWRQGHLQGYTSPGTGCCGVAARLFCPPEITVHILHPAADGG